MKSVKKVIKKRFLVVKLKHQNEHFKLQDYFRK